MAIIKKPLLILPVCALTFQKNFNLTEIETFLEKIFSPIKKKSEIISFSNITKYYDKEMGEDLQKIFYYFTKPEKPDNFHLKKIKTNKYEKSFSEKIAKSQKRIINLDPGYITEAKLVLFSAKDFAHRIYVNDGIYAEVQLSFKNESFEKNLWSYPDYSLSEIIFFFNEARNYLRERLGRK